MIELAIVAAAVVAGAVVLFVGSIRIGMLIGRRLDGWLQARYEAEQAGDAQDAQDVEDANEASETRSESGTDPAARPGELEEMNQR